MLFDLLAVTAPIFVIAGIGLYWVRSGQAFDTATITALVSTIGTPSLVYYSMTSLNIDRGSFLTMAAAAALVLLAGAIAGLALCRAMSLPVSHFLPALMFPNTGNMGLPVCLFAFGEKGLALAIGFFTVVSVSQLTIGASIAAGRASFGTFLRSPLALAAIAGAISLAVGFRPPEWAGNTLRLLGGLSIPLMLLSLGGSLAGLRLTNMKRAALLSGFRLIFGFAIGYGIAVLLGAEGTAKGVILIEASMPVAVMNYLLALKYNRSHQDVASAVLISTVLSFVTLPMVVALAWKF